MSKDEFRWYLRTGKKPDDAFDPDDHIKIGSFTLSIDDAKKYLYSFSTRRRVYKWADLNVSVWVKIIGAECRPPHRLLLRISRRTDSGDFRQRPYQPIVKS